MTLLIIAVAICLFLSLATAIYCYGMYQDLSKHFRRRVDVDDTVHSELAFRIDQLERLSRMKHRKED